MTPDCFAQDSGLLFWKPAPHFLSTAGLHPCGTSAEPCRAFNVSVFSINKYIGTPGWILSCFLGSQCRASWSSAGLHRQRRHTELCRTCHEPTHVRWLYLIRVANAAVCKFMQVLSCFAYGKTFSRAREEGSNEKWHVPSLGRKLLRLMRKFQQSSETATKCCGDGKVH